MKLNQSNSNILFFIAAALVTLYSEGYTEDLIPDNWARFAFGCVLVVKLYLTNAGYPRLPNGEMLPKSVRALPPGETVSASASAAVVQK